MYDDLILCFHYLKIVLTTDVVVAGIDRIRLGILANVGYEDLLFFQEVNIFISLSILLSPSISISNSVLVSVSFCNLSGDVGN